MYSDKVYLRVYGNANQTSKNIMNWKIILGALLILGGLKEMTSIIIDYRLGKLDFWPFGAEIGCIALVIAGIYLIRKGQKPKKQF